MSDETPTNPLAEIRATHVLCTHSRIQSGGIKINKAGCSCGAYYTWNRREAEHVEHVDAVIVARMAEAWDAGFEEGINEGFIADNPYRDAPTEPIALAKPTEYEEQA